MESDSLQQSSDDCKFDVLFDEMQVFRSRWNALNERCKRLEANLHEAKIEKAQLAAKLELSREHMKRVEKEKDELSEVVLELHKDLQSNCLHKWIDTLGQKLSSLSDNKIINHEPPHVIDDIVLSSSDDEESYVDEFVESPVIGRVTDENLEVNVLDVISSTSNCTANDGMDHDYVSPRRTGDTDQEVEENVRRISNNEADSSNEVLSTNNENISEVYSTPVSTNNNSNLSEDTTQQNDTFLEDVTAESNAINQVTTAVEEPLYSCDIRFENTETSHLNQTSVSADSEVSATNSAILDENPTENIVCDQISGGEELISAQPSPSIISSVQHEPSCMDGGKISDDDHLFISSTPLPEKLSQNVDFYNDAASYFIRNREISAIEQTITMSPTRFQPTNSELSPNRDFSVAEETSTLSPRSTASTSAELSPSRNDNEEPVVTYAEKTLEQIPRSDIQDSEYNSNGCDDIPRSDIQDSEYNSNGCDDSEHNGHSDINEKTADSPQNTPISDNNTPTNDTQSVDSAVYSATSSVMVDQPSQPITVTDETHVENSSKTESLQKDGVDDLLTSAKSSQGHIQTSSDETSNVNGIISHEVCLTDTIAENGPIHNQITSESFLEQGVNHEEILQAEGDQSSFVSDTEYFDDLENDDDDVVLVDENTPEKTTNREASPEELMCQIFGSPDRNSDVVDITNEDNCTIDLNLSEEEADSISDLKKPGLSAVKPELTVNLPRMFTPGAQIQESVDCIISKLEKDLEVIEETLSEPSKLKRSYPSSSAQEPNCKRSPLDESFELTQDSVQDSGSKKILKCAICKDDKVYETYSILDTHIIAKHPDPFPAYTRCQYGKGKCERHFRTTRKLHDHIRKRHGAGDKNVSAKKLPPGQKPWPCTICNKIYTCNNDLKAHLDRTHGKRLVPKMKQKKSIKRSPTAAAYSVGDCIICLNDEGSSEKYKTYQELDDHIFHKHPNPYPYYLRCPFCKCDTARHFKGLSWLNNHIANNHAVEVFQKAT
ncbi:uncharacterized protein LOC135835656 isoform X2 [Planococcus citri]|uniref:uncharacterized protein LOC135835656 isoform X2 n=1 Tax=Planococcus citri TaxID=170843 RepID=UPI0031FA4202